MLYPVRCKRITVNQSKVLKKIDCSGFFGGHPVYSIYIYIYTFFFFFFFFGVGGDKMEYIYIYYQVNYPFGYNVKS